ncbi:MAG: hypothetical protein C0490_11925, partial [Marivirga sp.]|nr:hypothetical protein [Marivirga sp.]
MAKLILYLLESSAILSLFYLLYVLVLRKETFFHLNRFFLLSALFFSLLFPLLSFDFNPVKAVAVGKPIEEISRIRMSYYEAMALWEFDSYKSATATANHGLEGNTSYSTNDWIKLFLSVLLVVYAIGIVVCLSRTIWTIRWIRKMISLYPQQRIDSVKVIKVPYPAAPFS